MMWVQLYLMIGCVTIILQFFGAWLAGSVSPYPGHPTMGLLAFWAYGLFNLAKVAVFWPLLTIHNSYLAVITSREHAKRKSR